MSEEIVSINLDDKSRQLRNNKRSKQRNNRGGGNHENRRRFNKNFDNRRGGNNYNNGNRNGDRSYRQHQFDQQEQWSHDMYQRERPRNRSSVQISNLHYSVTTDELQELAEKYGRVRRCHIDWDDQGRSKETGFIEFENENDARAAASGLNGVQIETMVLQASMGEIQRRGYFKR